MKKIPMVVMIIAQMFLSCFALGEVAIISKEIFFSPENQSEKIVRIEVNCSAAEDNIFFLIRDAKGKLIACLLSEQLFVGKNTIEWNGKDIYGKFIPKGKYQVYLSRDLEWKLDKTFGLDGRIGRFMFEDTINDPQKAEFKVPGVPISVKVNNEKLYEYDSHKAGEDWSAGRNYSFKDGVLTLDPKAGFKKDDRVRVDFYFPVFFQNPWDMEIDSQGNLWVILHWQAPEWYKLGRLLKILPKG